MGKLARSWPLGVAALLAAMMVAAGWPGLVEYDSVEQFHQALTGQYDDWHPPIMARLWAGLHTLFGGGAGPMLVAQQFCYWLGLGLIGGALARIGRPRSAVAILLIGLLPGFAIWQWIVLKDVQMVSAMLAAVGVAAWYRIAGKRIPVIGGIAIALLLGYATLVRANALFATIPLGVLLLPRIRWPARLAIAVAAAISVLALSPAINADLLGATPSGVRTTVPLFDLAAIAVDTGDSRATGIGDAGIVVLRQRHCVKAYFWDTLGDGPCGDAIAGLAARPVGTMYALLAGAVLHHPIAYAGHRLAHLNLTERWLVGARLADGWPPARSEPNKMALGDPGRAASWWIDATRPLGDSPLAWPILWLAFAIMALVAAIRRPASPLRDLALALLVSAVALEASFAVISIAADLRYHLWSMIATALALVLIGAEGRPSRRFLAVSGAALLLVLASGIATRLILPHAPSNYTEMLAS